MWWYVVGLGCLGAAIGYLVPLSESPLLGTLFPLIFGLAGGAAGIYSMKADITAPAATTKLKLLGTSLAAFCVALVAATVLSIELRDARRSQTDDVQISFDSISPDEALDIAALRQRLDLLGVESAEQNVILANAVSVVRQRNAALAEEPDAARVSRQAALGKVVNLLNELAPDFRLPTEAQADSDETARLRNLETLVNALGSVLPDNADEITIEQAAETGVSEAIEVLGDVLASVLDSNSAILPIIGGNPKDSLRLYALSQAVTRFISSSDLDGSRVSLQIGGQDAFIGMLLGRPQVAGSPVFEGFVAENRPPMDGSWVQG